MKHCRARGVTLADVVIALLLLEVGILALIGSLAMTARMVGRGRQATVAAQIAQSRLERLRHLAASTAPLCTHPQFLAGNAVTEGINEEWVLSAVPGARAITLSLTYPAPVSVSRDTFAAAVLCR